MVLVPGGGIEGGEKSGRKRGFGGSSKRGGNGGEDIANSARWRKAEFELQRWGKE